MEKIKITSDKKPEVKLKKNGTPKKSGGKRAGSGQPKKETTELINFRITVSKKSKLKAKYGKKLNQMFNRWADELLIDLQ